MTKQGRCKNKSIYFFRGGKCKMNDNKVLVIGIDGMDPKMTRRMVDEGKLPNIKKMKRLLVSNF